jgi:CPA1 family monovalent cation:H+ antiporter
VSSEVDLDVASIEMLLLVAALVAIAARRLHLPYTVGLVLAGVVMAFMPISHRVPFTKELIFSLFLPPLVFEAAFLISWEELRRELRPIIVLATAGVIIATAVVVCGMVWLLKWDWKAALLFGTLITATDPVSVIATFKEAKTGGRLRMLIEGESLLNDGTAAALFAVALAYAAGAPVTGLSAAGAFLTTAVGGALVGVAIGIACVFLMGRTEDHLVETTLSVVAAFGSFLLAEHGHLSGVLATLCAGLIIGNFGPLKGLTAKGRDDAETFWEFAAFVANSLIFLLIGMRLVSNMVSEIWLHTIVAIVLVLVGRAAAVFGCSLLFARGKERVSLPHQKVLWWGGLRGALALGLALAIPADFPRHDQIVAVSFAVVAFSVLVQGMTVGKMIKRASAIIQG